MDRKKKLHSIEYIRLLLFMSKRVLQISVPSLSIINTATVWVYLWVSVLWCLVSDFQAEFRTGFGYFYLLNICLCSFLRLPFRCHF